MVKQVQTMLVSYKKRVQRQEMKSDTIAVSLSWQDIPKPISSLVRHRS